MKVVALVSGGKDSCFSMHMCGVHGHQVVALANLLPLDNTTDELDSYMYQTVGHQLVAAYAACTGLPLYRRRILGSSTTQGLSYSRTAGDEVEDLFLLLAYIKEQHPDIEAVASGAIASDYQRLRVESVCSRLGLASLGYLWHQPQDQLLSDMIANNIEAVLVKVAAIGLDPYKHLGKSIRQMQPLLRSLRDRFGCNVCGEGGEYETLTLDCPAFKHGRIVLDDWQVVMHSPDSIAPVGVLHPTVFHVEPKSTLPDKAQKGSHVQQQQQQEEQEGQQQLGPQSAVVIEVPASWQPQGALGSSSTHGTVAAAAAATAWDTTVIFTASASHVHVTCTAEAKSSKELPAAAAAVSGRFSAVDTAAALAASLLAITAQLPGLSLAWSDSCFVHLYLADMAHFGAANDVYCKYFPLVDPPSRACVQVPLPQGCPVLLDVLFARPACLQPLQPAGTALQLQHEQQQASSSSQQQQQQQQLSSARQQQQRPCERRVLHVQSISSWAPSCIGPYSQATACNGLIYMAGQIPLDPVSMSIVPASPCGMVATIAAQTWRTLCSCQAVAVAVRSCFATATVGLTVYLSEACAAAGGQRIVQAALEAVWADRGLLDCLQVPAAVMQAAAAVAAAGTRGGGGVAESSSYTTTVAAAVQGMRVEDGSSDDNCDSDQGVDGEGQAPEQVIDDYLKPPAVACPLQPAIVYVTVPALPRGALLEVQPVLQDLAAAHPAGSCSSSDGDDDELELKDAVAATLAAAQHCETTSVAGLDAEAAAAMQLHVTSNTNGVSSSWQRVLVHLAESGAGQGSSSSCEQQAAAAVRLLIAAANQHQRGKAVNALPQLCTLRCWHASPAGGQLHNHAWQHALVTSLQRALSSSQQQITIQFVPVSHVASAGHLVSPCWAVVEAYSML